MDETANYIKIAVMSALGMIGGAVRVCGDPKVKTTRQVLATMLMSMFVGGITGAVLHRIVEDPMMLGAACSVAGYMGQITLVLLARFVQSRFVFKIEVKDRGDE